MVKPAPKGNKYAVGNNGGRPAIYDAEKLAIELELWSKKEDSFNLVGFCLEQDICDYTIYDLEDRSEEFSKSLRMARMRLSQRRDAMAREELLPMEMWKRYADNFDPFLYKHEEKKKDNDSKRRKNEESAKQQITLTVTDFSQAKTE